MTGRAVHSYQVEGRREEPRTMSRFVTVTEFAQRLTDAGCRVRWDGAHDFIVIAGRGPKSRSAYVCFYRDGGGLSYARSGAATPLRLMRAVLAWLRLPAHPTSPKPPPDAARKIRIGA